MCAYWVTTMPFPFWNRTTSSETSATSKESFVGSFESGRRQKSRRRKRRKCLPFVRELGQKWWEFNGWVCGTEAGSSSIAVVVWVKSRSKNGVEPCYYKTRTTRQSCLPGMSDQWCYDGSSTLIFHMFLVLESLTYWQRWVSLTLPLCKNTAPQIL